MQAQSPQLKDFILDSGLVSRQQYEAAEKTAEQKNVPPESILVSEGHLTEDDLRRMQAYVLGIPFINLKDQQIDFSVLSLIPEPIARLLAHAPECFSDDFRGRLAGPAVL